MKLTSRKFWISIAAFLGSIGTSIAGYAFNNETLAAVGMVCAMLSAAIYAACEAMVDKAALKLEAALEIEELCDYIDELEAEEEADEIAVNDEIADDKDGE